MKWKWSNLRYISQWGFLGFVAWYSYTHMISGPPRPGPLDSICPMGAFETLPTLISKGAFLQRTADTNFVMLAALLLAVLAFGGAFCGWICPLGTVGEWLYKLRKLIFKKDIVLPKKLHGALRYLRFVLLAMIVIMSGVTGVLMFRTWDPFANTFMFPWNRTCRLDFNCCICHWITAYRKVLLPLRLPAWRSHPSSCKIVSNRYCQG